MYGMAQVALLPSLPQAMEHCDHHGMHMTLGLVCCLLHVNLNTLLYRYVNLPGSVRYRYTNRLVGNIVCGGGGGDCV